MSKLDLRLQFRRLAEALKSQAYVAGGTGHAATTGHLRELLFDAFLRPHLPDHIRIRSGVIIDRLGNRSRQQDCVLVDSAFPVVSVGSNREALMYAESVIATIEIKTFLSTEELRKTMDSIRSTKALLREGTWTYTKGSVSMASNEAEPILPYVFAFDGAAPNTLSSNGFSYCNELNDISSFPEAICILGQGMVTRTPSIFKLNSTTWNGPIAMSGPVFQPIQVKTEHYAKDALFAFYRRLFDDVAHLRASNVNFETYFDRQDLE